MLADLLSLPASERRPLPNRPQRKTERTLEALIPGALEIHSPELMETQPELFAQHYAEAGLIDPKSGSWLGLTAV